MKYELGSFLLDVLDAKHQGLPTYLPPVSSPGFVSRYS